jgi:hypothetical protein
MRHVHSVARLIAAAAHRHLMLAAIVGFAVAAQETFITSIQHASPGGAMRARVIEVAGGTRVFIDDAVAIIVEIVASLSALCTFVAIRA